MFLECLGGPNLGQDISVRRLHVLPVLVWVFSANSSFFLHPKNLLSGGRLIGHSRLPVSMNVSVDGCLSLYVSP